MTPPSIILWSPDDRRALLGIQICKGTPTRPPPVPVSTICPWVFQANLEKPWSRCFCWSRAKEAARSQLWTEQQNCLAFSFSFFFVESVRISGGDRCYNLRPVIVLFPLSTSPRQPLPSAHRRAKSLLRDYSQRLQHLFWIDVGLFLEGGGGLVHFIHCIIALTRDPGEYVLMPNYGAMRTTVQRLKCATSPFLNVTSPNLRHDSSM